MTEDRRWIRKRVFALILPTVKTYWYLIVLVGGTGFVLGTIATMKSFLESTVINLVSRVVERPSTDVWQAPMDLNSVVDDSWVGDFLSWLHLETLLQVLVVYGLFTMLGAFMTIATAAARERITQHAFVAILDRAAEAATSKDLDESEWSNQPGGLAGAIQANARSLSGASALLVETVQYTLALVAVSWVCCTDR